MNLVSISFSKFKWSEQNIQCHNHTDVCVHEYPPHTLFSFTLTLDILSTPLAKTNVSSFILDHMTYLLLEDILFTNVYFLFCIIIPSSSWKFPINEHICFKNSHNNIYPSGCHPVFLPPSREKLPFSSEHSMSFICPFEGYQSLPCASHICKNRPKLQWWVLRTHLTGLLSSTW